MVKKTDKGFIKYIVFQKRVASGAKEVRQYPCGCLIIVNGRFQYLDLAIAIGYLFVEPRGQRYQSPGNRVQGVISPSWKLM